MTRIALAVQLFACTLAAQGWVDRTPANPLAGPSPRLDAALCWDDAHGYPVFQFNDVWEFDLGTGAAYSTYGSGCAGSRGTPSLAAQGSSLPLSLGFLGAPGCTAVASGEAMYLLTNVLGAYLQAGTGAVTRTAQAKMRDVVSVKDFGAVGDGVTDDTAAIQAALAVGGGIYFPLGTYMANDLTATLPVYIYGYGATIKRRNNQLASTFILSIAGNRSSVQGLNFDGNAANNAGHTGRHEGLRIAANNVTVLDSDSSNTPSGGTRVANCFYVAGNAATLENVTSSNAGYAAIRIDGDGVTVNNARITNFTEKGIVFDGTVGVSAKSLVISNSRITSASTDVNGQVCILTDSGSSLTEQLRSLFISNVYCELTGNITGSNVVKVVNTKYCVIDNFNFVQAGTNHASFRAQERVEYLTLSNGRMDFEFNLDSWDYRQITLQNVTVGKEDKSLNIGPPISGLYASQQILLTDVSVNGATSGSVRIEDWVGQVNSDGVALTEPNITINGFVQNANASTVPVFYLAMATTDITPGSIVAGDVIVITGYTNAVQTLTGSSSTERLIQRNPGNTFSREFLSASAPTTNAWKLSDRVYNTQAALVGFAGWICTAAGTPGTWKVFGQIGTATSIGGTPEFVGQTSVVAGAAYIAVGTSSSADWKKITP